uniref:Putative secreted protein n=1 Tax=Anopheles marajoara TaxID=58244 RepID=A0A2M4CFP4_9DIPT
MRNSTRFYTISLLFYFPFTLCKSSSNERVSLENTPSKRQKRNSTTHPVRPSVLTGKNLSILPWYVR